MQPTTVALLLLSCWLAIEVCECSSVVTLTHGGQLQGISTTYNNQPVDLFLGIRYAQPPVGDLRFEKPKQMAGWQGIINATSSGALCTQNTLEGSMIGQEDCLFLDITVPGNVQAGAKKPVMVWIHGGGYYTGSGTTYIGGSLATAGDVIVVSMNYRLGIFGFLSDGPGTGNYGLWDQRAALLWVKQNIDQFGGDPDLVTIFGESAGGGSVAAQTVGQHNDGLFKRAIQQSGSLFLPWSWYLSVNDRQEAVTSIKQNTNCSTPGKVYECLRHLSTAEVANSYVTTDFFNVPWRPVPDNDFFPGSFEDNPTYELSKRFDMLIGMNGQEGAVQLDIEVGTFSALRGQSIDNGVSLGLAREFLRGKCAILTPMSAELCAEFLIKTYRLDRTRHDRDRAVRLSYILGEVYYDVGIVEQLQQRTASSKSTYAYYFTELYSLVSDNPFFNLPRWMKRSATHLDELPFLFGAAFLKDETSTVWEELVGKDWLMNAVLNQTLSSYHKSLSRNMMQLWTNFARTGDPNSPTKPFGYPTWPQFKEDSGKFMNLNSVYPRAIDTPNKQRLDDVKNTLLVARDLQVKADKPNRDCLGYTG